jgi:hypothetical protein
MSNRVITYGGVIACGIVLANTLGDNWPIGLPVAFLSGALVGLLFSVLRRRTSLEASVVFGVMGAMLINIIVCDAKFAGYEPAMRGIFGASVALGVEEIVARQRTKKDRHNP